MSFALALPALWFFVPSKLSALFLVFGYYLAAGRGIPVSAPVFFWEGPEWRVWAYVLWAAASFVLAAPWGVFWVPRSAPGSLAAWRLCLAAFSASIPPLATIGWASPLMAAGWFFPRLGWTGFLFAAILLLLVRRFPLCAVLPAVLSLSAVVASSPPPPPPGWLALQTAYGRAASGSSDFLDQFSRSMNLAKRILRQDPHVPYILVPENIAGRWNKAAQELWQPVCDCLKERHQTLVIGAEIHDDKTLTYDNSLIFLGTDTPAPYAQRMPVPVSEWMPTGGPGTANAHWFDKGTVKLANSFTAAVLICYEQFLSWPILWTMATSKVDLLVTVGNQWWSDQTIRAIEKQSAVSWARLFGLPLISATNQ